MKGFIAVLVMMVLSFLAACSSGQQSLQVTGAWARPGEPGMNSAIYFTLQNSPTADALLDARSDVAESVQLHKTVIDANGSARMEHQFEIEISGGEDLVFAPGGFHIMLMNLRQPLQIGETINLTLVLRDQGEIHVKVPVESH